MRNLPVVFKKVIANKFSGTIQPRRRSLAVINKFVLLTKLTLFKRTIIVIVLNNIIILFFNYWVYGISVSRINNNLVKIIV